MAVILLAGNLGLACIPCIVHLISASTPNNLAPIDGVGHLRVKDLLLVPYSNRPCGAVVFKLFEPGSRGPHCGPK